MRIGLDVRYRTTIGGRSRIDLPPPVPPPRSARVPTGEHSGRGRRRGPAELLGGGRYGRLVPVGPEWLERFSVDAGVEAYLEALGFADDGDGGA